MPVLQYARMFSRSFLPILEGEPQQPNLVAIILIASGAAILIALLIVLLNFTVFARLRLKRQVREISQRFEYLHALLSGSDTQYIKRIENISQTNLLYVNIHMSFNRRFKEIRDKSDAEAQTMVNHLKDLLTERAYKELKEVLPEARRVLATYDDLVNQLDADLITVIKPEEDCRQRSLTLKEKLRDIRQDYYVKQADLTLVVPSFESVFATIEERFKDFESYVESAQYDDAENLLKKLEPVIVQLGKVLKDMPSICITIQAVIPDKLASLSDRYDEMVAAGYPLHHLLYKSTIENLANRLQGISKRVQNFDLAGVQQELDAILAQIDEYFTAFEKEKDARVIFERDCDSVYRQDSSVENKYIRLCNAISDIRKIFVISSEEQSNLDAIKNYINKAGATKRSLDTYIHSSTKQPYTVMLEKLNALREEAEESSTAIDDFSHYLMSLKSDSESALQLIGSYFEKLQTAKEGVNAIDLEPTYSKYDPRIETLLDTIDEAYTTLRKTPIDVAKVNGLVASFTQETDALVSEINEDLALMDRANHAILYGNRARKDLSVVAGTLEQAEGFYHQGKFKSAYDTALVAVRQIRGE